MFGGKEQIVKMEFENHFVGVVLDRFGQEVMLIPKDQEHFTMPGAHQHQPAVLRMACRSGDRSGDRITGEYPQGLHILFEKDS